MVGNYNLTDLILSAHPWCMELSSLLCSFGETLTTFENCYNSHKCTVLQFSVFLRFLSARMNFSWWQQQKVKKVGRKRIAAHERWSRSIAADCSARRHTRKTCDDVSNAPSSHSLPLQIYILFIFCVSLSPTVGRCVVSHNFEIVVQQQDTTIHEAQSSLIRERRRGKKVTFKLISN